MQITDIYGYWQKLEHNVIGRWLFNLLIPVVNPYTGSLKANVIDLNRGYARIELKDRRAIRNHLNSIHAIALTNLGEFTSGLALISVFKENMRGIPIEIKINFIKKARGTLTAECTTQLPDFDDQLEHTVVAIIKDIDNDEVARIKVVWKLGFKKD
ncbi:MAG: DUF4442 domain-containing protein [Gammaproteobacteria bacterium]|nr:DUF4442 domain-containing protein [Gammaproteobacteria bacterium]